MCYTVLMSLKHTSLRIATLLASASLFIERAMAQATSIRLLEPIGDYKEIPTQGGEPFGREGVFFDYVNHLYPWFVGTAAGVALLMIVFAGSSIVIGAGDSTERQNQLERLKWAILGLLMIAFSSLILKLLNPSFFID